MKKTILLIFILLAVFCCVTSGEESKSSNPLPGRAPKMCWGDKADKLFPKPPVLLEYERVFDAYEAGKIAEELPTVKRLSVQPVRLGSPTVWASNPQLYYETYTIGRLFPARGTIRNIWAANEEYAGKLAREGKPAAAISVLILNLSLSRQIVHVQPSRVDSMLSGQGLWQGSWQSLGKQLDAVGDHARAKRAEACVHQARTFLKSRVDPYLDHGKQRLRNMERDMSRLPKSKRDEFSRKTSLQCIREDSLAASKLIKQWDNEVETVASKQLIKELQKEYGLTE